jgi:5-formyltetrahydrofolate cyclo-ligase
VDATEVKAWRRLERARLVARRMGISPAVRREWGERITAELRPLLTERPGVLGVYWPFRAEFDPQPLIESLVAAGRAVALPVVIDRRGRSNTALGDRGRTLSVEFGTSQSQKSAKS